MASVRLLRCAHCGLIPPNPDYPTGEWFRPKAGPNIGSLMHRCQDGTASLVAVGKPIPPPSGKE